MTTRATALTLAFLGMLVTFAHGAIKTQKVEYKAGDQAMIGYLAWDDASDTKRPAVLVFPEWWGETDYPKKRAEQLAGLGYVGFAVDMFGDGKTTDDANEAGKLASEVKGNPQLLQTRAKAALGTLRQQPMVDASKIGAIGYCFGGTCVLEMARQDLPLAGVVSFHGDLTTKQPASGKVAPQILVCTGAADVWVPPDQVAKFQDEMKSAKASVKVVSYPGAHHSFTNPDADRHKIPNVEYNADADKKSWEAMKEFFVEVFK